MGKCIELLGTIFAAFESWTYDLYFNGRSVLENVHVRHKTMCYHVWEMKTTFK